MSSPIHFHGQPRSFSSLIVLSLVLTALVYSREWLRLRRTPPISFSPWRFLAFLSGLLVIGVAAGSPLGVLDHQSLTAHMVKHLLLMVLAAPLILFGAVSRALLSAIPNWFTRDRSVVMTRFRSLLGHVFDNSIFCWLAGTTTVVAWHVPFVFALGMSSQAWHTIEDVSFICAGLLFWKPIITLPTKEAQMPQWSLVLYLFLATVPCDILSAFLVFCGRVVYPYYLSTNQPFSLSALQDQECAGALMWVTVTFACLIPAVLITMSLLSTDGLDLEKGAAIASRGTDDLVLRIRGIDPVAQTLPAPPS